MGKWEPEVRPECDYSNLVRMKHIEPLPYTCLRPPFKSSQKWKTELENWGGEFAHLECLLRIFSILAPAGYHYRALHGGRARACKRDGSAARKVHLQGLVGTCGRRRRRPAAGGGVQ